MFLSLVSGRSGKFFSSAVLQTGMLLASLVAVLFAVGACRLSDSEERTTAAKEKTNAAAEKGEKGKYYDLFLRIEDVSSRHVVTVNGFPVEEQNVMSRATDDQYGIDLNTALIGEGNQVEVQMMPYLQPSRKKLDVGTIEYTAEVQSSASWESHGGVPVEGTEITSSEVDSAYKVWESKAQKKWEEYRSGGQQGAIDSMRAWVERNPLTVATSFVNEAGPDYSRVFEETPKLKDTPATRRRLTSYAIRLRDLMAEKDTARLVEEFLPVVWKGEDSLDVEALRSNFTERQIESIRQNVIIEDAYLDIDRSEVGLRPWAGGRIWELYYEPDGKALFGARTFREGTPEYTGSGLKRQVYVAELGGELKVVR